jgi:hypothetical protein
MPFEYTRNGVTFIWHGGQYIEIYWADAYRLRGPASATPAAPFEVANVWDSHSDTSMIDRSDDAFRSYCNVWIDENRAQMGRHLENSV